MTDRASNIGMRFAYINVSNCSYCNQRALVTMSEAANLDPSTSAPEEVYHVVQVHRHIDTHCVHRLPACMPSVERLDQKKSVIIAN